MSKLSRLFQYLSFVCLGLVSSITGALLPMVFKQISMSYSQVGLILSGQYIGSLSAILASGILMEKIGKKKFILFGNIMLIIGLMIGYLSKVWYMLLMSTVFIGICYGIYSVGINALCTESNSTNKGGAMNLLHFFFGVGAVLGPITVTSASNILGDWRIIFILIIFLPLALSILLLNLKIDRQKGKTDIKEGNIFTGTFIIGLALFVGVGIEVSFYGWLPQYWNSLNQHFFPVSLISIVFSISFTFGRLLSSKLADKIGLLRYILAISFTAMIVSMFWCFFPYILWTFVTIILLGLLLAGIYPTAMALITESANSNNSRTLSILAFLGSLGGLSVPLLIGYLAKYFDLAIYPVVVFGLAIALVVVLFLYSKVTIVRNGIIDNLQKGTVE